MKEDKLSRRAFIRSTSLMTAGAVVGSLARAGKAVSPADVERIVKNGRINQSVSRWCYGKFSLDELCTISKKMGLKAIDLLVPNDFPTLKKHGLVCSMVSTHGLTKGLNRKENHEQCLAQIRSAIDASADNKFPNVITFPGNRAGMPDDVGIDNMVIALKQIAGYAEKKKVTICFEYLNSKVDHRDYMFDNMAWGVEVCKRVGSESVKILYDIYHAQIMEGDIIRTLRTCKDYIGHYHTGGNPGRNEIDETQELYYPAIMRAIVETGFKGYVAHEFVPKRDPIESLAYAVRICDV
ncbi:MAG: TIM barrel protein [Sedimentisphaerales bacterium]|jgi:hydroxypyruvate isomerase